MKLRVERYYRSFWSFGYRFSLWIPRPKWWPKNWYWGKDPDPDTQVLLGKT